MTTILYARVSTAEQTLEHQETQARQSGLQIDAVVADHGVSGIATSLKDRPQGKRLYDMLRSGDTLVVRWVDRLGRNYRDVSDTIREFMERGVVVRTIINGMTFNGSTKDPIQQAVRDALIAFMAATAEAQAVATKEAQRAGIEHARLNPDASKGNRYKGRKPTYDREQYETVCGLIAQGKGASEIAKATGLSRQTIIRIRDTPDNALKALLTWGW